MSKSFSISGFPEWTPQVRAKELELLDRIRTVFERNGFCSIETPAVELLEVLASKGEAADKEIYVLERLAKDLGEKSEAKFGLHYDLTVPFARYVAQNFSNLSLPFKRYQIQKVWRGERPQEGRYREFLQCDVDIVDLDSLSPGFDSEIVFLISQVLSVLDVGNFTIKISNRKILQGILESFGVKDIVSAIRILDKLDKIGKDKVAELLLQEALLGSKEDIVRLIELGQIKGNDISKLDEINISNPMLLQGIEELKEVFNKCSALLGSSLVFDISLARGFDYYTGLVVEASLNDFPEIGTVCAGGRYDDLVSSFSKKKLPGVGVSLGFSRIFGKLVKESRIDINNSPFKTELLISIFDDSQWLIANQIALALREKQIAVEVYPSGEKLKKQFKYAERKSINFVLFLPENDSSSFQMKNLETGEQVDVNIEELEKSFFNK